MYYILEPEIAGHLGNQSLVDRSTHPPIVSQLHYEFDGWQGDDLLESFPCFIVTQSLKDEIQHSDLTGYFFNNAIVSKSKQFSELFEGQELPKFYWLRISGEYMNDDFSLNRNHMLVVSAKALNLLKRFTLNNCDISLL